MRNVVLACAVVAGVAVGAFAKDWVLLVLTVIFGMVAAIAYVVNVAGKSLFGGSERAPESPEPEIIFHVFVTAFSFFVPMCLAYFLR